MVSSVALPIKSFSVSDVIGGALLLLLLLVDRKSGQEKQRKNTLLVYWCFRKIAKNNY